MKWPTTRLGDVCRIIPGFAFKSQDWTDEGVPVVKIKNIRGDNTVDLSDCDHVPRALLTSRLAKFVLHDGDILVAMTGATAGKVGRLRIVEPVLLNQRVAKIEPDLGDVDPLFIWAVVSSDQYQRAFFHLADGAAQPNMSGGQIEGVRIPYPPPAVQRRIASILSAYDDLIENNTRRIAILEELARRIYEEWFVRFRCPGHENVGMFESELGPVPKGWTKTYLSDLCTSVEDGDWVETKDQGGSAYRLLQISNVGLNTFVETGNYRYVSEEAFKRLRCREIVPGNILVARMPKPIGRAWLVTPQPWRMITAVDVAILDTDSNKTSREFVLHFLNSETTLAAFAGQTSGTTRPRITRKQIESMPLIAPPLRLAMKFSEVVEPMNRLAAALTLKNDNLRATRDLLLPRLISGELDVSSFPEPTEAAVA